MLCVSVYSPHCQAQEYANSMERYAYLWVDDRQEFLRQFLLYGHMLTADEIDAAGEEGVKETPPELYQFKEQVDGFEAIYKEVEALKVNKQHFYMHENTCV